MTATPAQPAEAQCALAGEALKSRRALLRVVDRQAAMLEAIEDLRSALDRKDLAAMPVRTRACSAALGVLCTS